MLVILELREVLLRQQNSLCFFQHRDTKLQFLPPLEGMQYMYFPIQRVAKSADWEHRAGVECAAPQVSWTCSPSIRVKEIMREKVSFALEAGRLFCCL